MTAIVRNVWHPVTLAESIQPPSPLVKVTSETVAIAEARLSRGGTKVVRVLEPVGVLETMNGLGAQRTVVSSSPVYIPETWLGRGPKAKTARHAVTIAEHASAIVAVADHGARAGRDSDRLANTLCLLAECGPLSEDEVGAPYLYAFAAPASRRSAFMGVLARQWVEGEQTHSYGVIDQPSTMGTVLDSDIRAASPGLWDEASTIDVFVHSGEIASATDDEVLGGVNQIYLGGEVLGFRTATQLDNTDEYRLSGLLRGMYGTPMTGTAAGHQWALVSGARSALRIPWGDLDVAQTFAFIPAPFEQPTEFEKVSHTPLGLTLKPYAVTDIAGTREANDDWTFTWNRTSRMPHQRIFSARGTVDVDALRFKVEVLTSPTDPTVKRVLLVDGSETATYSSSQQTTDFGGSQSSVTVNIFRYNDWGDGYGNVATLTA